VHSGSSTVAHDDDNGEDDMTVVSTDNGTSAIAINAKALDALYSALRERRETGPTNQGVDTLYGDMATAHPYKGDRRMLIVRPETFGTLVMLVNQNLNAHKGMSTVASKLETLREVLGIVETSTPASATIEQVDTIQGGGEVPTATK